VPMLFIPEEKGRTHVRKWQVIKQSLPSLHRSEALPFIPA
jgi:hypothetical protein